MYVICRLHIYHIQKLPFLDSIANGEHDLVKLEIIEY